MKVWAVKNLLAVSAKLINAALGKRLHPTRKSTFLAFGNDVAFIESSRKLVRDFDDGEARFGEQ
jgi:hypothetical protein